MEVLPTGKKDAVLMYVTDILTATEPCEGLRDV